MEPPADLSAVVRAIDRLTALIALVIPVNYHGMENQSSKNYGIEKEPSSTELPASLASIPGLEVIEVNGPQLYVKFRCALCLQEWIVPIRREKLASHRPPKLAGGAVRWRGPTPNGRSSGKTSAPNEMPSVLNRRCGDGLFGRLYPSETPDSLRNRPYVRVWAAGGVAHRKQPWINSGVDGYGCQEITRAVKRPQPKA